MRIGTGETLLFIGDSITDCGRGRPVGAGASLGTGYVSVVHAMLTAACPEKRIRVLSTGTSGNTVRDLKDRWQTDVLNLKPDWLSVMIGINDVWRQFDNPLEPAIHVLPEEYETTLQSLVDQTPVKGLVLMTPYYIEDNLQDDMRQRMDEYSAIVRRIAGSKGAVFVDTQAAFDAVLAHLPSEMLAWDRVHPGLPGHTVIAQAFLKGIEFACSG